DQQQRRGPECAQRDRDARQPYVDRQDLKRGLEQHRCDRRAWRYVDEVELRVRQQVVDGDEEEEDRAQRDNEGEPVRDGAVAGDPRRIAPENVEADRSAKSPTNSVASNAINMISASTFPRRNGRFGRP